jgi:uncharacterized membrane protein
MNTHREHGHVVEDMPVAVRPADSTTAGMAAERPAVSRHHPTAETVVVVAPALLPQAPPPLTRSSIPIEHERTQVRVAPHVLHLVTIPTPTSAAPPSPHEQGDLNTVVQGVLIIGVAISTALMLVGIGLDLIYQRDPPMAVPDVGEVLQRVVSLRPSGFLALGLLALIATPILRVMRSIIAFVYERDWRYAGVTTLVLLALIISLLLSKG